MLARNPWLMCPRTARGLAQGTMLWCFKMLRGQRRLLNVPRPNTRGKGWSRLLWNVQQTSNSMNGSRRPTLWMAIALDNGRREWSSGFYFVGSSLAACSATLCYWTGCDNQAWQSICLLLWWQSRKLELPSWYNAKLLRRSPMIIAPTIFCCNWEILCFTEGEFSRTTEWRVKADTCDTCHGIYNQPKQWSVKYLEIPYNLAVI